MNEGRLRGWNIKNKRNFSRSLGVIIATVTLCPTVVLNTLVVAQTVWKRTLEIGISWPTTHLKYVCWPNLNFPGCTAVFKQNPLRWRQHAASLQQSINYLIIYIFLLSSVLGAAVAQRVGYWLEDRWLKSRLPWAELHIKVPLSKILNPKLLLRALRWAGDLSRVSRVYPAFAQPGLAPASNSATPWKRDEDDDEFSWISNKS